MTYKIALLEPHEFLGTLVFMHRVVVGEYALAIN